MRSDLFKGRINRRNFIIGTIASFLIYRVYRFIVSVYIPRNNHYYYVLFFIYIALFIFNISLLIRRWHDLGKSGWMTLLFFIPIINLYFFFEVLFRPGQHNENQYGLPPTNSIRFPLSFSQLFIIIVGELILFIIFFLIIFLIRYYVFHLPYNPSNLINQESVTLNTSCFKYKMLSECDNAQHQGELCSWYFCKNVCLTTGTDVTMVCNQNIHVIQTTPTPFSEQITNIPGFAHPLVSPTWFKFK